MVPSYDQTIGKHTLKCKYSLNFFGFSKILVSENFGFPTVWSRTFWFRKLREVCRIHFHLVAPPKTAVVPSYDQKTKKITTKKATTINMWAHHVFYHANKCFLICHCNFQAFLGLPRFLQDSVGSCWGEGFGIIPDYFQLSRLVPTISASRIR